MVELTSEEMKQLDALVDPDTVEDSGYKWDESFQRYIIGMLLTNRHFLIQSLALIRPTYFTDDVHKLLCRILFRHFEQYKTLPGKILVTQQVKDEIEDKDEKVKVHYLTELSLAYQHYVPGLEDQEFLLDKITNFAKMQALKVAFNKSLTEIKKAPDSEDTWTNIYNILREAMQVDRNFDVGLDYFQSFEERYLTEVDEGRDCFTSGFKSIDNALIGGGLARGEIYSWVGLSGSGKSLCLVTAALRNVVVGQKVLYVSLEMDEHKIAERFDAQLARVNISHLDESKDLIQKALKEEIKDKEDPRLLIIKQFPSGEMNVNTLRAYLQQLALVDFHPDIVIVDYIGEMRDYPGMATWESRYRIVRDLRALASETNALFLTAMQPNRGAREAQNKAGFGPGVIDDENLADAFGQIRPLDGCWSINQMKEEKEANIARVFVMKHRHGKSRFTFYIEYDDITLALNEVSKEEYIRRWKEYKNLQEKKTAEAALDEDINDQMIAKAKKYQKKGYEFDDMGSD